jgi:hypothetical protein
LLAEKAPQYDDFARLMDSLLKVTTGRAAGEPTPPEFNQVGNRAGDILRRERGLIEATPWRQFDAGTTI